MRVAEELARDEDVWFLIAGDGELRDELEAVPLSGGLAPRVVWAGFQRDVPAVCFASDVVMLTSDNEGTPVSLIEAQAAGVPVISTRVGGAATVVGDQPGTLVAADDVAGLAHATRTLLDDLPAGPPSDALRRRSRHGRLLPRRPRAKPRRAVSPRAVRDRRCAVVRRGSRRALGRPAASARTSRPDAEGIFERGPGWIGQTRLAIIDVRNGDPPIANEDRTIGVALNGEIYNYRQLRADLQDTGHALSTACDTESSRTSPRTSIPLRSPPYSRACWATCRPRIRSLPGFAAFRRGACSWRAPLVTCG